MIGLPEIVVIGIAAGIVFFGRKQVVDWAKTFAQAKKTYNKELSKNKK